MVMVTLFCAIDGEAGAAFSVKIDDDDSVDDLKDAIKRKKKNDLKDVDTDHLQLFLAKKKNGTAEWLTEKDVQDGVSDTSDLKALVVARQILSTVGLSGTEVEVEIEAKDLEVETSPVNVLVVVPEWGSTAEDPRKAKLTYLDNMLKNCTVVGDLPMVDAVLNLFK